MKLSRLADGTSPFKPSVNGLILIAVALLLFLKATVSLFRTTISVRTSSVRDIHCASRHACLGKTKAFIGNQDLQQSI